MGIQVLVNRIIEGPVRLPYTRRACICFSALACSSPSSSLKIPRALPPLEEGVAHFNLKFGAHEGTRARAGAKLAPNFAS